MEDKFLQEFLKTGYFDIGEQDERLEWLQKSIAELAETLSEDYSLLPKYSLVAIDPNISDTESILTDTETIVTSHWKTLRIKFPGMPRNLLRGVILNALNIVGKADALAARIIYLTTLNFYPYAKLNTESKIVESLLSDLGDIAEENAVEEWSLIEEEPELKLETLKINGFKFGSFIMNKDVITSALQEGAANSGYNPYNQLQAWSNHFSAKSGEGITDAFNAALEEFSKSLSPATIETPINKFFTEFKKSLDANLKASFASITAVERRSKLLWWKETLYSPSLKKSYRGLDKNLLPVIMGADLNNQLPEITPISVDYLLRDTLYLLNDKQDESIKFKNYLAAISQASLKATLKPYFDELNNEAGRISITDFIGLLVNDRITLTDFHNRTGISEDEEIKLSELSVAVLHDLLTQRLRRCLNFSF
jgi:hypothetical protein